MVRIAPLANQVKPLEHDRDKRLKALVSAIGDSPASCSADVWKDAQAELNGVFTGNDGLDFDDVEGTPWMQIRFNQFHAALKCLELRQAIESGCGASVMEAASLCAAHGLVMPGWLASNFVAKVQAVIVGEAKSWNDSFGPAYPKGTNIKTVKAHHTDAPKAYEAAVELISKEPTRTLDKTFYEDVGEAIGIGGTRATELVKLEEARNLEPPIAELKKLLQQGMSRFEAWREWHDLDRWRTWQNAGGTAAEWRQTFDREPPGDDSGKLKNKAG